MTEKTNKCTACSCDFTDDEGGVHGNFGILPMSFCPTCLSCMLDMAEQLNPREWVGLTNEEFEKLIEDAKFTRSDKLMIGACIEQIVELVEAKLKEKNT
jgi:hypothetical protein